MIDQLTGPKYKTRVTKKMKLPTSVRSKMPIRDEVWFKDGLEGVTDNYSCVANYLTIKLIKLISCIPC